MSQYKRDYSPESFIPKTGYLVAQLWSHIAWVSCVEYELVDKCFTDEELSKIAWRKREGEKKTRSNI